MFLSDRLMPDCGGRRLLLRGAGLKDKRLLWKPGDFRSDSIRGSNCGAVGTVLFFSFCGPRGAAFFLESPMPLNEI